MSGVRIRGIAAVAVRQLRHSPVLTLLAILGVAIAVVSLVLFASLGAGIVSEGETELEAIGGDIWISGGPTTVGPSSLGYVDHTVTDAHELTADIASHENVQAARAFAFQSVYASPTTDEYEPITAVGVTGGGNIFSTVEGETLAGSDQYYADGNYDGPFSGEILLDEQAAERLGVEVGDEVHVGGTLRVADEYRFTVQGISNDISDLTGTPTIVLHLAELQHIAQSTHTDPATAIIVAVDETEPAVVQSDLEATYPELTIRTNHEQFQAVLERQSVVLAGALAVIVLGMASGVAVVAAVFGLVVASQRHAVQAIRAIGISNNTVIGLFGMQGLVIGLLGALTGLVLAIPAIRAINYSIARSVGFEELLPVEWWVLPLGFAVALGAAILASSIAWRLLARGEPIPRGRP